MTGIFQVYKENCSTTYTNKRYKEKNNNNKNKKHNFTTSSKKFQAIDCSTFAITQYAKGYHTVCSTYFEYLLFAL